MLNTRRAAFSLLFALASSVWAQYPVSLLPAVSVEDTVKSDSLSADSTQESSSQKKSNVVVETSELKIQALTWVRRLIYRGFLDDETTGTSATYALTGWSEVTGPYGPVLAHVSVTYLGAVSWLGKPSAWFQATYKSFDNGRPSVDFDIVLASGTSLGEAYRALWRVNKEKLSACNFLGAPGQIDYDREDQPRSGEETVLKLFAGEFPVTIYNGSGADGSKVVAYRGTDVPPLSLVRLGYGNMSLNLRDRANDVEPKLQVPLPTSR